MVSSLKAALTDGCKNSQFSTNKSPWTYLRNDATLRNVLGQ